MNQIGSGAGNVTPAAGAQDNLRVFSKAEAAVCCRAAEIGEGRASSSSGDGLEDILCAMFARPADEVSLSVRSDSPLPELCGYILKRFHRPLGVYLLNIDTLMEMAAETHGLVTSRETAELREIFSGFQQETMQHLMAEEDILYPWIISGNGWSAVELIDDLHWRHKVLGVRFKTLRSAVLQWVGDARCDGRRALLRTVEALGTALDEHIYWEDRILFPRVLRAARD